MQTATLEEVRARTITRTQRRRISLNLRVWLAALMVMTLLAHSPDGDAQILSRLPERGTFYMTPTIEGIYSCDEGLANPALLGIDQVNAFCAERMLEGSAGISRLLDELEPGGPKGQVQVGYLATLQLMALYRRAGAGWEIDEKKLDLYLQVLTRVKRPVVVYLLADHFDTQGPLAPELIKDPANLMLLRDGKPALSNYFGYLIAPYTMQTEESIAVNRYRFAALRHVAARLKKLPKEVRDRIIGISLAGELHHMFPEFESGTGRYENIQVTDYSAASIAGFQKWLAARYGSLQKFNAAHGFAYTAFEQVPAPGRDMRKELRKDSKTAVAEHYDAYADGLLPVAGWLWDPQQRIGELELHIDGKMVSKVNGGFNRLDVYRAAADVTSPNVGYRVDFDYSALPAGLHTAQVVARGNGINGANGATGTNGLSRYLLGQIQFEVGAFNSGLSKPAKAAPVPTYKPLQELEEVKGYLDLPKLADAVYFNPLARDWNNYRGWQVRNFMERFFKVAIEAGLPVEKLYSHQIVPRVNSSWNPQLFAADETLVPSPLWKTGVNMYGGSTDSAWMRSFLVKKRITDYGVPEFNPQQWKTPGTHLRALKSQYLGGARFVSPYYFTTIPDRYKSKEQHGVNAMELRPDNMREGSNQFYQAIREFAKQ